MRIKKLTKKEVLENCARLWLQYRTAVSNQNNKVTYEEFCNDVLKEWEKQNKMSLKELKKYRKYKYKELIGKVNKKLKKGELDILNESDKK